MSANIRDETLRWYGRRRGHKLRPGRQALIKALLPRLRLELPPAGATLDFEGAFERSVSEVWLEVGFGAGEHLAAQAGARPDIGFIGCEPFNNGIAGLLSLIESEGITNVRVFDDDARKLLPCLPEASIGRIYALFTDPWPKKKHHRRRFIGDQTVGELARVLADGGELRLASDHGGYVEWMLERVARHPDFSFPAQSKGDWTDPPAYWVETRYERKARKQGLKPVYLRFLRRPRTI